MPDNGPPPAPALIETMRLEQGHIALWPWHRVRLLASARALAYPLDPAALDGWLHGQITRLNPGGGPHHPDRRHPAGQHADTQTAHGPSQTDATGPWRLRLLLAADGGLSLASAPLPPTSSPVQIALAQDVLSTAGPLVHTQDSARQADQTQGHAPGVLDADPFWLQHKTTHRPWFAAAQHWLQAHPGLFDLIFVNPAGDLCEGSRSNVYIQNTDGQWLTPPVACGLLPGVQRQALLDQGAVREARLSPTDLRQAPALRVSNALRGWLDAQLLVPTSSP